MRFGVHVSIAGGLAKIVERATARSCETIQIFTRNPRGWQAPKELAPSEVKELGNGLALAEIEPLVVHLPYLVNLASPEQDLHERSIEVVSEDLLRAKILGSPYVVVHMGNHKGAGEEIGLKRVVQAINAAVEGSKRETGSVTILLENMSGQGSELGYDFEHLKVVVEEVRFPERVGICLDLCHAYQAGHDVATQKGLDKTLKTFDELIGLDRLQILHASDSKAPLGSHLDQHEHIGEGFIKEKGFGVIVNHPLLRNKPVILETPIMGPYDDQRNLTTIRRLVKKTSPKS